MREKSFWENGL